MGGRFAVSLFFFKICWVFAAWDDQRDNAWEGVDPRICSCRSIVIKDPERFRSVCIINQHQDSHICLPGIKMFFLIFINQYQYPYPTSEARLNAARFRYMRRGI